ncbi:hypothetical protein SNE40_001849 [Patella caerulea]|uniref:Uncharacterized protein n=1 Tax=Patella caerulea TaxID=87958 RepID=A0AAN8PYB4_PATCE
MHRLVSLHVLVILFSIISTGGREKRNRRRPVLDETFYLSPRILESVKVVESNTRKYYHFAGQTRCPDRKDGAYLPYEGRLRHQARRKYRGRSRSMLPKEMTMSSCPCHLRFNVDEFRKPRILVEAACNCVHCYNNTIGRCEPIHYFRRVVRRRRFALERIAVGCTCVYQTETDIDNIRSIG